MFSLYILIVAAPPVYKFTNSITSTMDWITSSNGCPNLGGLIIHAIVLAILVRLVMYILIPGHEENFDKPKNCTPPIKSGYVPYNTNER